MNSQRNVDQGLAGVPPHGDQVPPLKEKNNDDQASVNPPILLPDGHLRAAFIHMDKAITTQELASTTEDQAMTQNTKIMYPEQTNKLLPWPPV